MDFPKSPDEVIDPRWSPVLRAEPTSPAEKPREGVTSLDDDMRAIIDPWMRGERTAWDTLEALRRLADRRL